MCGPTPGNHWLDKGPRNSASLPSGTSTKAAGLRNFDATALTNLLLPTPSLTEIFSDCSIATRISRATSAGGRRHPLKSKYPSSMLACSTSGVKSRAYENIHRENCSYLSKSPGKTISRGHNKRARAVGIGVHTPYRRASYEADAIIPRDSPPTATGRPRSRQSDACSTDAKNASASKCAINRPPDIKKPPQTSLRPEPPVR